MSEFAKYNLKMKYFKEFEIVMSNVILKKLNLIKKISVNKILFLNAMIKKIDEQK